jgi:hypothetical protein
LSFFVKKVGSGIAPALSIWARKALESGFKELVSQVVARTGDNEMGIVLEQTPYQCDQCGATNIIAAPVMYQQGTHTYSTRFSSGTTQSFSAHAVAPPRPRGYVRTLLLWGPAIIIFSAWTIAGGSSILEHPLTSALHVQTVFVFLFLGIASIVGLVVGIRKIARYNHEVYPHLRWNWEHTYICRRCGRSLFIPT